MPSLDFITWRYSRYCELYNTHKNFVGFFDWWGLSDDPLVLLVLSPVAFAYYTGLVLKALAYYCFIWLIEKSELDVCAIMCFLSLARDGALSSRALDPQLISLLSILVSLSSALRRLIRDMGFLSTVIASSIEL